MKYLIHFAELNDKLTVKIKNGKILYTLLEAGSSEIENRNGADASSFVSSGSQHSSHLDWDGSWPGIRCFFLIRIQIKNIFS